MCGCMASTEQNAYSYSHILRSIKRTWTRGTKAWLPTTKRRATRSGLVSESFMVLACVCGLALGGWRKAAKAGWWQLISCRVEKGGKGLTDE